VCNSGKRKGINLKVLKELKTIHSELSGYEGRQTGWERRKGKPQYFFAKKHLTRFSLTRERILPGSLGIRSRKGGGRNSD